MQNVTVSLSDIKDNSNIIKPNFHLNFGKKRIATLIKNGKECTTLGNLVDEVYTGGIFKRVFVENIKFGIPYISATHMMNTDPLSVAKIISRKYTPRQNDMTLEKNQILVSCAGTVGNIRLIATDLSGIIGSQDIIRVISNNKTPYGFIYAYLASKTAYNYIQSFIYGSVVPRIDPKTLAKLPIPIFTEEKQEEIHQLIVDAAILRVEANKLLNEANDLFHSMNDIKYNDYHLTQSENQRYSSFKYTINSSSNQLISIKAKNHSQRINEIKEIWRSKKGIILSEYINKPFKIGPRGMFKRVETTEYGEGMVSQSDLHRSNPKEFKRVLIKRKSIEDFANNNQVLFPSVGNGSSEGEILFRPTLAYKSYSGKLLSGDIGRLDCKSLKHAAYLFVVLKSKGCFRMLRAFYYGTQLRRPLWQLIKDINIPIVNDSVFNSVSKKVIDAFDLKYEADRKENEAISLIEKEIDLWQN